MTLVINTKKAGIDKVISYEAKRLLRYTLARFDGLVSRVKVRFFDVNGPKGGVDKRCRISAKLRTAGQITILGEGGNYMEALGNCLDRFVRSIRREIEKRRHNSVRVKRRNDDEDSCRDELSV